MRITGLIIFLVLQINLSFGQRIIEIDLCIPLSSGIASADWRCYEVINDSLFINLYSLHYASDSIYKPELMGSYNIDSSLVSQLKKAVATIDSDLLITNSCIPIQMCWPRFQLFVTTDLDTLDVFVANAYDEIVYNVVDIFNKMMANQIISYNKHDLIKGYEDCERKRED